MESIDIQEHGVVKHEFAIFPKSTEEGVVGKINNASTAHWLGTKNKAFIQLAVCSCSNKTTYGLGL